MTALIVIISLSILIFVHELGHFTLAKLFKIRVDEFGIGFPPKLFSWTRGETKYSINLLPFGGFVKIYGEDGAETAETSVSKDAVVSSERDKTSRGFADVPIWKRSFVVLAGIFMNIVLGWVLLSIVFMIGVPSHLMVTEVAPNSPAALQGLKNGDVIQRVEYNGAVLRDPINIEKFIALVKDAHENPVALDIFRDAKTIPITITGRDNPPVGEGSLGLALVETGFDKVSPLDALLRGARETYETLKQVVLGFISLFGKLFTTPKALETVTGPIGIFSIASQATSLGIVYLLNLMALISLNLAVLNLIPFPALDGGRFLFLLFEKLKGSPISRKIQLVVNATGFAALILLMILVTVQDVGKLLR